MSNINNYGHKMALEIKIVNGCPHLFSVLFYEGISDLNTRAFKNGLLTMQIELQPELANYRNDCSIIANALDCLPYPIITPECTRHYNQKQLVNNIIVMTVA